MENDDKPVYSGVPGYPIFRETRKWMQAKDQKSSKKTNKKNGLGPFPHISFSISAQTPAVRVITSRPSFHPKVLHDRGHRLSQKTGDVVSIAILLL